MDQNKALVRRRRKVLLYVLLGEEQNAARTQLAVAAGRKHHTCLVTWKVLETRDVEDQLTLLGLPLRAT